MKTYHFFPVFIVLVISYVGIHSYAARWLARSFSIAPVPAYWLRIGFLVAAFSSPFIMFLKRFYQGAALETVYAAGYSWMGIILLAAFIFAVSDLGALLLKRTAWFNPRQYAFLTAGILAAVVAWSVYGGQRVPDVKRVTVTFKDLPAHLDGFRIAQVSDMHVDSFRKLRQFSAIIDRINAEKPDLVLVTGDLVDPGITCRAGLEELSGKIKSRLGLHGCPGNHEYYYGISNAIACYESMGINILKNSAEDLGDLRLIGLGDIHTEHLTREDVRDIIERNKDGKFTVLMTHQPVFYKDIAGAGNFMVFSGHTHKGQIFPFHVFTKLFYPYFYGLYRIAGSAFYVTSGSGTWGPPLRWLAPAEIPLITLKKA